jgi:RimJ/RimL family protein N-acetyltransferase
VTNSDSNSLVWQPVPVPRPITLHGRYVTLEPIDADRHSAALWDVVSGHDEVWTWLADGPYAHAADLRRSVEEKQRSTNAVFLAILPESQTQDAEQVASPPAAAGYASFMSIEPAHGVVEVGNILLSPRLQRTRAATEAMYLMTRHVFDNLGYRRYEWKCNANNEPSRRAAIRLGFTFEGIFHQHMVVKGRNRDTAWFAMLDSAWPARKRAFERWFDPTNFDNQGVQRQRLEHFSVGCSL